MQESLHNEGLFVDRSLAVLLPQREVIGHVSGKKSLEGGVKPIKLVIGIHFFEAFFIVMIRIPEGIVQINE
jgi:hypothetical protein